MSKSLFSIAVVALVVIVATAFAAAMPRDRVEAKHLQLRAKQQRRVGTPDGCIDNITLAALDVGEAVKDVFVAVADCPKPNNTAQCVADISNIAEQLTNAASKIDLAVTACGAQGSACVNDLLTLASDLADAAKRVALAVQDCQNKEIGQCVEQVVAEIGDLDGILTSIKNAITQCKSN